MTPNEKIISDVLKLKNKWVTSDSREDIFDKDKIDNEEWCVLEFGAFCYEEATKQSDEEIKKFERNTKELIEERDEVIIRFNNLKQQLSDVNKIIDDWGYPITDKVYDNMSFMEFRELMKKELKEELKTSLSKGDVHSPEEQNERANSTASQSKSNKRDMGSSAPKDNDICSKCGETKKEHALGKYCYDKDGNKTSNVFVASKDERSEE